MQFSPKKTDLYISFLRLELQRRILKDGKSKQNLSKIFKLEQIRLLSSCTEVYKTNIACLTKELTLALSAKFISKGRPIFFYINGSACGGLNISVFEGLLCEIAKFLSITRNNARVNIKLSDRFIEITADQIIVSSYINKLIKILDGTVISVKSEQKFGIKIPITPAKNTYVYPLTARDYIENPLSAVNLAVVGISFPHDS